LGDQGDMVRAYNRRVDSDYFHSLALYLHTNPTMVLRYSKTFNFRARFRAGAANTVWVNFNYRVVNCSWSSVNWAVLYLHFTYLITINVGSSEYFKSGMATTQQLRSKTGCLIC
jgi:hypothetical protein